MPPASVQALTKLAPAVRQPELPLALGTAQPNTRPVKNAARILARLTLCHHLRLAVMGQQAAMIPATEKHGINANPPLLPPRHQVHLLPALAVPLHRPVHHLLPHQVLLVVQHVLEVI